MEKQLNSILSEKYGKTLDTANNSEIYYSLLQFVKDEVDKKESIDGDRKVYYISAEFLIGKLLSNNLINLGIYDEAHAILKQHGKNLEEIEEVEPEPSLGNGGLGRLAACFLDSIATLGLPGDGIGLNYHLGLFRQMFVNKLQKEMKNEWIEPESWLKRRDVSFNVPFKNFTLHSTLYDIDVIGYDNGVNQLHLFDLDSVDEHIVTEGISFDERDIQRNLTLFLYPDDSTREGQLLRIYQEYFMVSNAAQYILMEMREKGYDLHTLHEHVVIQINDTHPSMVIPELIRLLMLEGIHMKEAIEIVSKTCAYTNHTILSEALEKWPMDDLKEVVPHLVEIIEALDAVVYAKYEDENVQIIDAYNRVHMAHIDIHYGFSVNGVAAIHTEILKQSELKPFYDIYPEKFSNKTNGITFRRWLMHCNRELCKYISNKIGTEFYKDATKLEDLLKYVDDVQTLHDLAEIKQLKKEQLKDYLYKTQGIEIDSHSIFDIQIKRLHEYKRQQMNALYIIYQYLQIKKGIYPSTPVTYIFGAKAAPAYTIAKDIIHVLLCLSDLIEHDEEVRKYMRVVMVENYNVSKAEKLIPACDISEQISLASKEASGTGNMKFMLNGAVTLGTQDGANVEIGELVGKENIYTFGESSETVIEHYENQTYNSRALYESNELIKELVDFLVSDTMIEIGHKEHLERLYNELLNKDWFMTLLDIEDYIKVKNHALKEYEKRDEWMKKSLVNIAKAGFFSSDRTIEQYNEEIWKLK